MLVYGVSAADDIEFTGQGWDAFALDNGGHNCLAAMVTGRTVWDFLGGAATRQFYEKIFHRCRRAGEISVLTYRCDSPQEERLFAQRISPGRGGTLRLESRLVRARALPALAQMEVRSPWRRCSICLSVSEDGAWWLPAARSQVGATPAPFWTVCPTCTRGALARLPAAATAVPA